MSSPYTITICYVNSVEDEWNPHRNILWNAYVYTNKNVNPINQNVNVVPCHYNMHYFMILLLSRSRGVSNMLHCISESSHCYHCCSRILPIKILHAHCTQYQHEIDRMKTNTLNCGPAPNKRYRLTSTIRYIHRYRSSIVHFAKYTLIHFHTHHAHMYCLRSFESDRSCDLSRRHNQQETIIFNKRYTNNTHRTSQRHAHNPNWTRTGISNVPMSKSAFYCVQTKWIRMVNILRWIYQNLSTAKH